MAEVPRVNRQQGNSAPSRTGPPRLNEGAPSRDTVQDVRFRTRRHNQRPWQTRNLGAPLQAAIREVPIVGKTLSDSMTNDPSILEDYRVARPIQSRVAAGVGAGLPQMVMGPLSLGGRVAAGGALGAADAAAERMQGEDVDPIMQTIIGAGSAAGAHLPGKVITPNPQMAEIRRRANEIFERQSRTGKFMRERANYVRDHYDRTNPNVRAAILRAERRFESDRLNRIQQQVSRADFDYDPTRFKLSDIPSTISGGAVGLGSHFAGADPGTAILAGTLAAAYRPVARSLGRRADRLLQNPRFRVYAENELLGPRTNRALHGATAGQFSERLEEAAPEGLIPYEALRSQIMGRR